MTSPEWFTSVAQLAPAVVAIARCWQLHDRVKKLENARDANGPRVGTLESKVDVCVGRVEELSRRVWER